MALLQICFYLALGCLLPALTLNQYNRITENAEVVPDLSHVQARVASKRWELENMLALLYALLTTCTVGSTLYYGVPPSAFEGWPVWLILIWAILSWYAALVVRTMGDFTDPPSSVPRNQMIALRRPRYVWYKMRLRARMFRLHLWWALVSLPKILSLWEYMTASLFNTNNSNGSSSNHNQGEAEGGDGNQKDLDTLATVSWFVQTTVSFAFRFMTSIFGFIKNAGVIPVTDNTSTTNDNDASWIYTIVNSCLYIFPLLAGLTALYSILMCSAQDFRSTQTPTQAAWLWHPAQSGEMKHQKLPLRILSQNASARKDNNNDGVIKNGNISPKKSALKPSVATSTFYTTNNNTNTNTIDEFAKGSTNTATSTATITSSSLVSKSITDHNTSAAVDTTHPEDIWTRTLSPTSPNPLPKSFFRPLRIVIITVGTRGDVQPYLVLAAHIKDAGHSVAIATSRDFKVAIEALGIEYLDSGIERITQPSEWVKVTSTADFIRVTGPRLVRDFKLAGDYFYKGVTEPRADVIVGTAMTISFALDLSEATGIPCWVAKLAPELPTGGFVTPGSNVSSIGLWNYVRCWAYWIHVAIAAESAGLSKEENSWRMKPPMNIQKIKDADRLNDMEYTPQLLGFSRFLFPKPTDYPDWAFQCGFWTTVDERKNKPPSVSKRMMDWLQRGGSVAVVTFGSMTNIPGRVTLLADITKVLLEKKIRVLVLTGWQGGIPAGLEYYDTSRRTNDENGAVSTPGAGATAAPADTLPPPHPLVMIAEEAPHDWLFRQVLFVVHHGGAGTTARALACGIPSMIIPVLRWADQTQYGQLVTSAKVGILVEEKDPSIGTLRRSLTKLLARSKNKKDAIVNAQKMMNSNIAQLEQQEQKAQQQQEVLQKQQEQMQELLRQRQQLQLQQEQLQQKLSKNNNSSSSNTDDSIIETTKELGAWVRAEVSADTALALFESCICNILLPPHEADAIHPRSSMVYPLWDSLNKVQRMCIRHCVPCHRLRAECGVVLPSAAQIAKIGVTAREVKEQASLAAAKEAQQRAALAASEAEDAEWEREEEEEEDVSDDEDGDEDSDEEEEVVAVAVPKRKNRQSTKKFVGDPTASSSEASKTRATSSRGGRNVRENKGTNAKPKKNKYQL